jgi:3-oxoacyl-[acyl-carrier-protein] synthase III
MRIRENNEIYSVIKGTGSYIPDRIIPNESFLSTTFYDNEGKIIEVENSELIRKFEKITNISERRYVSDDYVTSDMAFFAADNALKSSNTDPETLDYIIVAHNFGDVKSNNRKSDIVPSLAARVKAKLGIKNPDTVCYDVIFGCPGWLQGVIQANYYIKSGDAKRVMVIGAETLSRVSDPHDRDSMIYSDGAGATIFEGKEHPEPIGILSHSARSDTFDYVHLLGMDKSYNPNIDSSDIFLKMNGRKLYEYALNYVPVLVKNCMEKAKLSLSKINKVLIHQANGKMDEAILQRLFKLFNIENINPFVMPMTISKLGNNSVASLPILLDMILNGKLENQTISPLDNIVFASVGAGMNINAITYRAV